MADQSTSRWRRKAPLAAFLSFLFPGAGQLYNGQWLLAAALALPVLVLLVVVGALLALERSAVLARLFDIRVLWGLIVLDALVLLWRFAAIAQAHRYRARLRAGRIGTWVTGALLLVTVAMHALPGWYALIVIDTLSAVALEGDRGEDAAGLRRNLTGFSGPSGEPLPPPSVQPDVGRGERVNVLLVGVDSGVGRDHALTDTMMVVSIDPDGRAAMISVPRDLVNAPLPDGRPYQQKLNSLLQTANADPASYPFGGGIATLKATIGALLGAPIHYFAAVDMAGFAQVIDAIGGVDVDVERPITDPLYPDTPIPAGRVTMDGQVALVYVRARYGPGDDDFRRADRQQRLLGAVREKLGANVLTSLPSLLDAVKNTIATDVPSARIPELAQLVQETEFASIERVVIQPPDYVTPSTAEDGAYVLVPDLALIRELGQELIGG